jgi:hypothetical protein
MHELAKDYAARAAAFRTEAHAILGVHEQAKGSRVVQLGDTYGKLTGLNLQQDDLFRQALRCVENELYRAAHVMAWAGFMDYLEEKIASDGLVRLHAEYPAWAKHKTIEDLRENVPERQIVESTRKLGLCTKNEMNALVSLLNKRNECAHPSGFYPQLNESLGYISELIQRLTTLMPKTL